MIKFINVIKGAACLCLGFLLGISIKITYENSTFKSYYWKHPPVIVNCYGKGFSKEYMERAINYWETIGQETLIYLHNPKKSICRKEFLEGFIIIRKRRLGHPTLASTVRRTSFNIVKSAEIYYNPGSQKLMLINEHELGHAFGYTHIEEEGHIMHPLYNKMGKSFWVP